MTIPILVTFSGGASGNWRVDDIRPVSGASLSMCARVWVQDDADTGPIDQAVWTLRGTTSNTRYTQRSEVTALNAVQQGLARPQATQAALIPIRKSKEWWALAQDERRAIFQEQSKHISIGMDYLPGVARRLHHCREMHEPFDFVTWFEYSPEDTAAFDEMLGRLRASIEWTYVEHEVDIRLTRIAHAAT